MSGPGGADVPLLERLAGLPAVPVSELIRLLEGIPDLSKEPLLAGLLGVDEQGEPAAHPLLGMVIEHLKERPAATCYAALLEALTGIWNAAVRTFPCSSGAPGCRPSRSRS